MTSRTHCQMVTSLTNQPNNDVTHKTSLIMTSLTQPAEWWRHWKKQTNGDWQKRPGWRTITQNWAIELTQTSHHGIQRPILSWHRTHRSVHEIVRSYEWANDGKRYWTDRREDWLVDIGFEFPTRILPCKERVRIWLKKRHFRIEIVIEFWFSRSDSYGIPYTKIFSV